MIKLLQLLATKKSFLLFVLLELIAFILIIDAHDYAKTKTYSLETEVSGFVNNNLNGIHHYFELDKINDSLQTQNARLLTELTRKKDSNLYREDQLEYLPAYVISNQYKFDNNTILINKGRKDGIQPEMGVINSNGIVGVVQQTSQHFAKLVSVLNRHSKISVSLKNTRYTGFLQWNHTDPNIFSVVDMPVNANITQGDTIVTSGISNIFPKGIPVGKIINFEKVPGLKSYRISILSFTDMTNLDAVYVIKNKLKQEFDSISNNSQ